MTNERPSIATLTDEELLTEVRRLAAGERRATVDVIHALMQLDERRLYLAEGCSSLFTYCTQVLHFSEQAAYGRIEAARAARRVPAILPLLEDGSLTLTAVGLLAPHLTAANQADLLAAARHKSKREIEQMVAAIRPRPPAPTIIRRAAAPQPPSILAPGLVGGQAVHTERVHLSEGTPAQPVVYGPPLQVALPTASASKPAVVAPLSPESYKVQVTISRRAHDHLRRAQELLRHSIPNGDAAQVIERALALLVQDLERKKSATVRNPRAASRPRTGSRHVPSAVRREVWHRDGGQCAFVGAAGRCTERGFLELHHVIPFADGGASDAANLQLRCRAHNAYEAEVWFGPLVVREASDAYEATRSGPSRPANVW
jgi:5-methylcytosine-specific restriction endonuclease McrA